MNWRKIIASYIILAILVSLVAVFAPFGICLNEAQADTNLFVQPCTIDNNIYVSAPTTNYGTSVELDVMGGPSNRLKSILQFDISTISAGSNITAANFSMYYYTYAGGTNPNGQPFVVYRVLRTDWNETQSTWNIYKTGSNWSTAGCANTTSDYTLTNNSSVNMPASYGWVTWNITGIVQDCINASLTTVDIIVVCSSATSYLGIFRSSEYATSANTPSVSINYTLPLPTVTTQAASSVEETTATGNGNITATGGVNATIRGICYSSTNATPTTADSKVQETGSFGTGAFTESLTGLTEGVLYYARAFATNPSGTSYGAVVTFLTKPMPPTSFTATVIDDTEIDITWDIGAGADNTTVVAKKSSAPTNRADGAIIYDDTSDSYNHTGLSVDETWYYIAYSFATDGGLTQYSDAPDASAHATTFTYGEVTTSNVTNIGVVTARYSANITNIHSSNITKRGFVWDTSTQVDPDDALPDASGYTYYYTDNGSWGTGTYYYDVTTLSVLTTYYVRAVIYNGAGYNYGDEVEFITLVTLPLAPTDFTVAQGNINVINLTWTKGTYADDTIIVCKQDGSPSSITDGYVAYNGTLTSANISGVELNMQTYYFAAFSYNTAGYSTTYAQGNVGGKSMVFIAFIVIAIALTFFAFNRRSLPLSFMAAVSWLLLLVYTRANPIAGLPTGSYGDQIVLWLCILMMPFMLYMGWAKYRVSKPSKKGYRAEYYNDAGDYVGRYETPVSDVSGVNLTKMSSSEYKDYLRERRATVLQNRKRYGRK